MSKSRKYKHGDRRTRKPAREFLRLLGVLGATKTKFLGLQTGLKTAAGRSAAKRFALQIDLILDMVLLPYETLMYMHGYAGGLEEGLLIALETALKRQYPQEHAHRRVRKRGDRDMVSASVDAMSVFFTPEYSHGVRSWLFATVVYA